MPSRRAVSGSQSTSGSSQGRQSRSMATAMRRMRWPGATTARPVPRRSATARLRPPNCRCGTGACPTPPARRRPRPAACRSATSRARRCRPPAARCPAPPPDAAASAAARFRFSFSCIASPSRFRCHAGRIRPAGPRARRGTAREAPRAAAGPGQFPPRTRQRQLPDTLRGALRAAPATFQCGIPGRDRQKYCGLRPRARACIIAGVRPARAFIARGGAARSSHHRSSAIFAFRD